MSRKKWKRSLPHGMMLKRKVTELSLPDILIMQTSKFPDFWKRWMTTFRVVDVHPSLATYLHSGGTSALDTCLVPEDWVSTARWNLEVRTLHTSQTNGHKILKLNVTVRPTVLNNPRDAKHETIPTEAFMPGKDGRLKKDNRSLNSLVRLLHRTHHHLFDGLPRSNGFVLDVKVNRTLPSQHKTIVVPPLNGGDMQHGATEQGAVVRSTHAARELHSTRNDCTDHTPHSDSGSSGHMLSVENTDPLPDDAPHNLGGNCSTLSSSRVCNAHLTLSSCYWSWWRSLPAAAAPSAVRPYVKARKFLHSTAQWVNVARAIVEDLIAQSQGAILSNLDGLIISNGSVAIPRSSIQAMFEVIDECLTGIPFVPTDSSDSQVRGLGSMVAFWERMRNICPKVNLYNGPILQSNGLQCMTSDALDNSMLATRGFWFEEPVSSHHHWDDILEVYKQGQEWPEIPLPNKEMLLATLLHTKDSAPGPDGLPYAAWRLLPELSVDAMMSYLYDILDEQALPPLQVGVWIPKAKMGPEADNFRPFGMSNTLDRL